MSIFRSLAGAIKARGLDTSGIYNSVSSVGALTSNLQTPGDNSFTRARAMRRQRIQDALGLGKGKRGRGALDALFNRGARGERRRQRMLAAGAAPSIAEQEGTSEVSGMMEGAQASGGVIGAASSAAAVQPQQNLNNLSQDFSLPQTDLSLMDPRVAYRTPKPRPQLRPQATYDYATGGRASFVNPFQQNPYRMFTGGLGNFIDGRGSVSTADRGRLYGGVDARHSGLSEEQVNSNIGFSNLFGGLEP